MKPIIKILIVTLAMVLSNQCEKEVKPPSVNTIAITNITPISAVLGGEVISDGGETVQGRGIIWNAVDDPNSWGYEVIGNGTGSFSTTIYSFLPKIAYIVKAYAYNQKGTTFGEKKVFTTLGHVQGTFTDLRDGNTYNWIEIGSQLWMSENLNYKDGSGCWVYDNDTSNAEIYGRIYNWVIAKDVCPSGWHLPTKSEWEILIKNLGGEQVAGGKLKVVGTDYWNSPNLGATNSSGFNALPAGVVNLGWEDLTVRFDYIKQLTAFWTSTEAPPEMAWLYILISDHKELDYTLDYKYNGCSVRCIKD